MIIRVVNEDRDARIEGLLKQGVPKVQIADRLGISRDTVDRVGARVGFPASRRGPVRWDWNAIREYYEAGHTAADCKRRFGFTTATWEAAIGRGEIVPRPRSAEQLAPGKRRQEVAALLEEGIGIAEIAERLRISKPTVCYHARKLGIPPRTEFGRRYDWSEIRRVYESGVAMRACRRRFGFSQQAWNDAVKRGDIVARDGLIPMEDLLVAGRRTSRGHLKRRLIDGGLKEERCEQCGITEWLGKPLSVQLHHINGDGLDNRLENLSLLCANCHSQTDTYGGRNGHRRPRAPLKLVEDAEDEAA